MGRHPMPEPSHHADRIPTAQGGRRWYPATVRYTLNRTG
jgi:hypothetical protein